MEEEGGPRGGGGVVVVVGYRVGLQSPTQLDRVYVWPGSMPATCPDISERLLGSADISICPLEKKESCVCHSLSASMHVCVHFCECVFSSLCVGTHVHCLFFTLAW